MGRGKRERREEECDAPWRFAARNDAEDFAIALRGIEVETQQVGFGFHRRKKGFAAGADLTSARERGGLKEKTAPLPSRKMPLNVASLASPTPCRALRGPPRRGVSLTIYPPAEKRVFPVLTSFVPLQPHR
jgi:hypothetical protein